MVIDSMTTMKSFSFLRKVTDLLDGVQRYTERGRTGWGREMDRPTDRRVTARRQTDSQEEMNNCKQHSYIEETAQKHDDSETDGAKSRHRNRQNLTHHQGQSTEKHQSCPAYLHSQPASRKLHGVISGKVRRDDPGLSVFSPVMTPRLKTCWI